MRFPEVAPSRADSLRQITEALRSEGARVYIDASVLIHCYEMSRSACGELLTALGNLGDRARVPVWAAQETWDVTRARPSKRPLGRTAGGLSKRLQDFRAESLRYVDEDTFEDMSVEQYAAAVEEMVTGVDALVRRSERIEPGHDDATARLLPFIARHALASDMTSIYAEIQATGEMRFAHEVPPGFRDGGTRAVQPGEDDGEEEAAPVQKGKRRNRHGDLILWLEALQDCADPDARHLIVLTRDNTKGDWVYKPERVIGDDGRPRQNGGLVTLPLPLLEHEALRRCPTLEAVHVISLEMFTQVIQSAFNARVGSLARALQATSRPVRAAAHRGERRPQVPADGPVGTVTFSTQDMIHEPSPEEADTPLWTNIAGLRAEGWDAQNEAAVNLGELIAEAGPEAMKQIGRGVVAASKRDAVDPVELALEVLANSELPAATRANLLVGMLAETYFDENGEPAKPAAHPEMTNALFERATDPETRQAYAATIDEPLDPIRRLYVALPGEPAREVRIELFLNGSALIGAQADGVDLLELDAPESRRLLAGGRAGEMPVAELVSRLAREFVVPAAMLRVDGPTNFQIELPDRIGFIAWGPSTGEQLR